MADTIQYDLTRTIFTIGPVIVSCFGDGDVIKAKRDEDLYIKRVGAGGQVARAKNGNMSGTVEVILMQNSPAALEIFGLLALDNFVFAGDLLVPILVKSPGTHGELITATQCWIKTLPEMTFGKEVGDRTFVFDCADLRFNLGAA